MDKQNFTKDAKLSNQIESCKKQKTLCQQICKFAIYELGYRFAKNALSADLQIRFELTSSADMDCC